MPPDDDELEQRVRQLEHDHRLTRWHTGRVDRDLAKIAATQQEHTELLTGIVGPLDSTSAQLRSLTQMVGEVPRRLLEPSETDQPEQ